MSEPSYFDNPREAKKLFDEAMSWVGTPFRPFSIAKGETGGVYCVGLVSQIMTNIGATDKWEWNHEDADYESTQAGEKVLDWLRGKGDDPQSKKLAEILVELKIPEVCSDPEAETPRDFFKPGDILVLKHYSLFHLPVIIDDDLHFVNAIPRAGVIEGTIQDGSYSQHLVAAFRLKPKTA